MYIQSLFVGGSVMVSTTNGKWTMEKSPNLVGKVVVITGGNSGIGFEAARALLKKGAEVVLGSRDHQKAQNALVALQKEIPQGKLAFIPLDLASLESVRLFADQYKKEYDRLDLLLNNAGIMMVPYGQTEDGFESQLGINHLGHFALTGLLIDLLLETPNSRVVNISSNAHYGGEMDFSDLLYESSGYTPMNAYGRSKLANLLFTYELQRRLEARGSDSLALAAHPGISATGLADHFVNKNFIWLVKGVMSLFFQSAAMGALPGLRAAVDPDARGGEYYGPDGKGERSGYPVAVTSTQAAQDQEDAAKLWEASQKLTGIRYLN
jgi:NAD(P)-dependent dehydrogenase (short-subunit alcohol dehydrogenase family)